MSAQAEIKEDEKELDVQNKKKLGEEFIEWTPLYETKHKLIDEQHRELVKIINELYKATCDHTADTREAFIKAIKKCIDYTQYHFKMEEKLMELANYSDIENHKEIHRRFLLEIVEQLRKYEDGKPFVANKYVKFLKDWLLEHIGFQDKKLVKEIVETMKAKGI